MINRRLIYLVISVFVALVPLGVYADSTPHWVHYTLLQGKPKLPEKVVVLPANVEVIEVTAGGVKEEVPAWSNEARENILKSLTNIIDTDKSLNKIDFPRLPKKTTELVNEHMALYKLVVNTAARIGWEHKARRFDYSIGPGLAELKRKTGADTAVFVYGRDYVSTAGRKTKAVLGNIPIINIFTGPPPELGHSFIHIGIVDLETGNLLWMNSEYREGATNLQDFDDTNDVISTIFEWYPGIEKYRDVYVK